MVIIGCYCTMKMGMGEDLENYRSRDVEVRSICNYRTTEIEIWSICLQDV